MMAPRALALVCVAPLKVVAVIIVGASPVVVFVFDGNVDVTVPEITHGDVPWLTVPMTFVVSAFKTTR